METKCCTKCNEEKDLKYFEFRSDTKKYRNHCKMCNKGYLYSKEDKLNNILDLFNQGLKECGRCKSILELSNFSNDKQTITGKTSLCKECVKNKYDKEELRNFAYKTKYGITLEDYNNKYKEQKGCCDICKGSFLNLVVDHCHTTGKIRGLLCNNCNSGIGFFQDDISTIKNSIEYLIKNK